MNIRPIGSEGIEGCQDRWIIDKSGLYDADGFVSWKQRSNISDKKQIHPPLKDIIILEYFRASGCAVMKLEQLEKDVWALAGAVRALHNLAKRTRGNSKWLEVGLSGDGEILCQPKSPRREKAVLKEKREAK